MIYVTGDMHGERERFRDPRYGIRGRLEPGDSLIVCGDFKFIFDNRRVKEEDAFLDELEQLPWRILFCDGNHENFPRLATYPEMLQDGGWVRQIRKNIFHLMRGQVYELEGNRIFVMGGGHSFGEDPPLIPGRTWWPQESPSAEEYREAEENLRKCGYRVDYIITHTAPLETMRTAAPDYEADGLNRFLDDVCQKVSYRKWYFGHLHLDRDLHKNQVCLWYGVRRLGE